MSDSPISTDSAMSAAMSELGIDSSKLDASEETEGASTDTEVVASEEETQEEVGEEIESVEGQEEPSLEGEEKVEAPVEEPKLTAKEFQEIQDAKNSLELERKAFTEQRATMEKEFQEKYLDKVKDFDEMDAFLASLAAKDPDLFGLIQSEFQEHTKQYSNPIIQETKREISELRKELDSFKSKASDEVVLTKLDAQMNEVKNTLGKDAEALGLKVDYKPVEDLWAKGLDPKAAFYAVYGEALTKASISKGKVATAIQKNAGTPKVKTAGSLPKANAQDSGPKNLTTDGWVQHFAKQLTGKAS